MSSIRRNVVDGFRNTITKIGVAFNMQNAISKSNYVSDYITSNPNHLESIYRSSWIIGAIIDMVAEDMAQKGVDINSTIDNDQEKEILSYLSLNGVWNSIELAIKWSRLFGGSIATLELKGQNTEKPLNYDSISKGQFTGIGVYDRWNVEPSVSDLVIGGPDHCQPKFYKCSLTGRIYHHSRVLKFIGIKMPYRQELVENYWGESIVERLFDRLVSFDSATMGAANLLERAYNRTIGIASLREIIAAGGKAEKNLVKMFKMMAELQTNEGITLLDKDDTFETHSYTFSGVPDTILQFGQQLSGASGIPLIRLFGQSPVGFNSTGESDIRMYYDNILTKQESTLRPKLHKLLRIIYINLFGEDVPKGFDFAFNPLWQMNDSEKIDNGSKAADSIVKAYEAGVISHETAIDELKQQSEKTGLFTNVDEDDLTEAVPPIPNPDFVESQNEKEEIKV